MSLIVAVKSCRRDQSLGYHQAIRDTWGRGVDVRFFVGGSGIESNFAPDEVALDCKDDYEALPFKTKAILEWSTKRGFDFTFLCDNDTFLKPDKLYRTDFQKYDYSGRFGEHPEIGSIFSYTDGRGNFYPNCHPWASGGIGYFLSRHASLIVLEYTPMIWAEDMHVGQCLGPYIRNRNISACDLKNFHNVAAWHFLRTNKYPRYNPEMMYRSWALGSPQIMYDEDRRR